MWMETSRGKSQRNSLPSHGCGWEDSQHHQDDGQRKKAPVGGEQLEAAREEAAEYRPTGKNTSKDLNPGTEWRTAIDRCFCTRQPRQVVRTATCGERKTSVAVRD